MNVTHDDHTVGPTLRVVTEKTRLILRTYKSMASLPALLTFPNLSLGNQPEDVEHPLGNLPTTTTTWKKI